MSSTKPGAPLAWTVSLARSAQKQLDKLPARGFARIDAAIEGMRVDPFAGDVVHLTNTDGGYRRRVGDYRILFDAFRAHRHVEITAVSRRTTTTYRKQRR